MVFDTSLLNTQQYKVCIKGKVKQSRERSSALFLHLSVVAIKKGAFRSPSTKVTNFTYFYLLLQIFKTREKSEFHVLIKHCFLRGKILFKESNGLISIIWTLLCWKQELRGGMLTLNEKVIPETEAYFEAKDKSFDKTGIKLLEKHWNQCITVERDYVDE